MIVGLLFGLIMMIPENYKRPSNDIKVETSVVRISLDEALDELLGDELDDWDREDHIEELEEEEEE